MRKRLLSVVITVVMIVSMMPAASFGAKPEGKLVILATSDVHCAIERSVDKETGAAKSIGYAGFAGYKNTVEKTFGRKNVVALDCGDALQGSLVGSYSKGMSIVRAMNAVGYDVCVPGNHDFDYTAANYFNNIVPALNADVVSCNIKKTASDTTVLEPYVIKKYKKLNNIQIAYVGITTPSSPVTSNPNNFKDEEGNVAYDFCANNNGQELYAQVQDAVDSARKDGADIVVAAGHLGDAGAANYYWDSSDVIANTNGIDAFIDGHAHQTFAKDINNNEGKAVPTVATGTGLVEFGRIEIDANKNITVSEVDLNDTSVIDLSDPKNDDKRVADVIKTEMNAIEDVRKEVVGETEVDLTINGADGKRAIRTAETNLGDLSADAFKAIGKADVAIINGGAIRSNINAGEIAYGDVVNVAPFGNNLCVCKATGLDIMNALEYGAMKIPAENGGFLQVSGITFKINPFIPSPVIMNETGNEFAGVKGERRVYDVRINGSKVNPEKIYIVASNDFLLRSGGDGVNMFLDNEQVQCETITDADTYVKYIRENLNGKVGQEYANAQNRITYMTQAEYDQIQKEKKIAAEKTKLSKSKPTLKVKNYKKYVKLSWNKNSVIGVSYKVYRATKKTGKYKLIKTTKNRSINVKNLTRKKTYYFKVRAAKKYSGKYCYSKYSRIVQGRRK